LTIFTSALLFSGLHWYLQRRNNKTGVCMNKKLLLAVGMGSLLLLGGCASGPDEATTSQLNALSSQVEQLSSEVAALKSSQSSAEMAAGQAKDAAMSAQDEANRANQRIDNIAQSYTK
jgi:murein lipoprotein